MVGKRKDPAAKPSDGGSSGVQHSRASERRDSRRTSERKKARNSVTEVWIHVAPDGTERRFSREPSHVPTLRVERIGDWEVTTTPIIWLINPDGITATPKIVRPRGKDWESWPRNEGDHSRSTFRRPRNDESAAARQRRYDDENLARSELQTRLAEIAK